MIKAPDVVVSIERGIATVEVERSQLVAEVRDYDVEQSSKGHAELWTDPDGRLYARRYVTHRKTEPLANRTAKELKRFAGDLEAHAGLAAKTELSTSDVGLHVLQIEGVDFYFYANGTGYDGWGRAISQEDERPR